MSPCRLKQGHVLLTLLGPNTRTEQPFPHLGFKRATPLHITNSLAFGEGGGETAHEWGSEKKRRNTCFANMVFYTEIFSKVHQMHRNDPRGPKSVIWAGAKACVMPRHVNSSIRSSCSSSPPPPARPCGPVTRAFSRAECVAPHSWTLLKVTWF